MFKSLDTEGTGLITLDVFKAGMAAAGLPDSDHEAVDKLFKHVDTDGSNEINYTEFLAVAMKEIHIQQEALCWEAFRVIDKDGDGHISIADLQSSLSHQIGEGDDMAGPTAIDVRAMLQDADLDGDGVVSFGEFMHMLGKRSGTGSPGHHSPAEATSDI